MYISFEGCMDPHSILVIIVGQFSRKIDWSVILCVVLTIFENIYPKIITEMNEIIIESKCRMKSLCQCARIQEMWEIWWRESKTFDHHHNATIGIRFKIFVEWKKVVGKSYRLPSLTTGACKCNVCYSVSFSLISNDYTCAVFFWSVKLARFTWAGKIMTFYPENYLPSLKFPIIFTR